MLHCLGFTEEIRGLYLRFDRSAQGLSRPKPFFPVGTRFLFEVVRSTSPSGGYKVRIYHGRDYIDVEPSQCLADQRAVIGLYGKEAHTYQAQIDESKTKPGEFFWTLIDTHEVMWPPWLPGHNNVVRNQVYTAQCVRRTAGRQIKTVSVAGETLDLNGPKRTKTEPDEWRVKAVAVQIVEDPIFGGKCRQWYFQPVSSVTKPYARCSMPYIDSM